MEIRGRAKQEELAMAIKDDSYPRIQLPKTVQMAVSASFVCAQKAFTYRERELGNKSSNNKDFSFERQAVFGWETERLINVIMATELTTIIVKTQKTPLKLGTISRQQRQSSQKEERENVMVLY